MNVDLLRKYHHENIVEEFSNYEDENNRIFIHLKDNNVYAIPSLFLTLYSEHFRGIFQTSEDVTDIIFPDEGENLPNVSYSYTKG